MISEVWVFGFTYMYNQYATYSTKLLCPSSTLKQAPLSMSHILEGKKEKERLGWADVYGFQFLDPLETILKEQDTCSTLYLLSFKGTNKLLNKSRPDGSVSRPTDDVFAPVL